jgi:xylulose-5-phosphate/fructose-6-phosphate phosphoketolase
MNASPELLAKIDAWWRAANHLSAGQIFLLSNPLLREPLRPQHIKPRLLGPLGHHPGLEPDLRPHEPNHRRA